MTSTTTTTGTLYIALELGWDKGLLGKRAGRRRGTGRRPGGVVGPRRQEKRLMGLDNQPHRRRRHS